MSIAPASSYFGFENDGFYKKRHLFFRTLVVQSILWYLLYIQYFRRSEQNCEEYENPSETINNSSSEYMEEKVKDEEEESDGDNVTVIVPSPVYPAIESYLYNTSLHKYRWTQTLQDLFLQIIRFLLL